MRHNAKRSMAARIKRTGMAMLLLGLVLAAPIQAHARAVNDNVPLKTMYHDPYTNDKVRMQNVYRVSRVVTGQETTGIAFNRPNDLFVGENDQLFIADTGNNRIVELDASGQWVRTYGADEGDGKLNAPEGVFADSQGTVYVADTGNKRVAVFGPNGHFLRAYGKPESELLPERYYFVPKKLVVDARGGLYVVIENSYQGLLRMDREGRFKGFFGANKAELDLMSGLKQKFYTQEQLDKETANRPPAATNLAMDASGFFVTITGGGATSRLKLLDAAGIDRLGGKELDAELVDAAVDRNDFLYALDRRKGNITVYDPEGRDLVDFAQLTQDTWQRGMLRYPTSLAVNAKAELWVADSQMNVIQLFTRTEFGENFFAGISHYVSGDYEKSKPNWEAVKQSNDMIHISYQALGKIALSEGRYADAMRDYRLAYDAKGYSEGFWNVRQDWIQSRMPAVAGVLAVVLVAFRLTRSWRAAAWRKIRWPGAMRQTGSDLRDALRLMIHPYEGFYRLKERRVPLLSLAVLVAAVVAAKLGSLYMTGFIARPADRGHIDLTRELLLFLLPWLTWVVANYLVSTVKDGEGRFREVAQASAFSLVPYVVFTVPVVLASNVLALEEQVLLNWLTSIMWIWIAVLFFVMTQVIHQFDFMESAKNAMTTVVTIALIWVFGAVMSGLAFNLYNFFYQIYREVLFRGWI
ncbi:YIP1 family protein [Paenibacillus sp. GCM10027626]|uniref:YIP1 family protein n=1 Tax=Paenibacillus sp. GCM10027626 TaxID=3273411 RepID=UPI00362FF9F6